MDLYIQNAAPSFEKSAAEVSLPEDANSWPNEIMQELYKQVPYIADFDPQVMMDRVDAERGYGFGHVEVHNKTEMAGQFTSPEAAKQIGVQAVRIPVIVKDRKLQPLDVLVTADAKALPLTEGRLRQALFRPQAFDVTGRTPGDMSMVGQLYPPYRQNYGFGGGGMGAQVGMGKEGSGGDQPTQEHFHAKLEKVLGLTPDEVAKLKAPEQKKTAATNLPNAVTSGAAHGIKQVVPNLRKLGSILTAILPTIDAEDYHRFADHFADKSLQAAYQKNASATGAALKTLLEFEPQRVKVSSIEPSVVQVRKESSGYSVKVANHNAWAPTATAADRGYIVRTFGEKVALAADMAGSVTLTEGEGAKASPEENRAELVSSYGYYRVQDTGGGGLQGFVFPNLYDVDGTALPMALFTDGSHAAVQDSIVGERQTEDVPALPLSDQQPSGHGCFVRQLDGAAEATIPMTISGGYADDGHNLMQAETYDGRTLFVAQQPNIKVPTMVDGTCLIPADYKWLPLGEQDDVELVSEVSGWGQQKEASREFASVMVRAGGEDSFSLDGFVLSKVAQKDKAFISLDDTLFLLGGLGTDLDYASQKLAEAVASWAPVRVKVARVITPLADARLSAQKSYEEKTASLPNLRVDLVKAAAFIPDPMAVDTVLSLGFINPENMMTFVSYLPQIDQTQSKLCEVLLAARLGLSDVPVSALEKTVKSLESTIDGLKVVAFQKS